MKRSTVAWIVAAAGFAFLLLLVCAVALVFAPRGRAPSFALGGRVGVVDIEGIILSADRFRDTLARFKSAPGVKSVVVRINSPGGGVAASQELFSEIRRFRKETGKPVVVSMESVAASGGYYAAVAADHIVANPGTITGSIGVIMQWMNYGDLLEWAKVRAVTLKTGALKDAGNPSRPLTDEERKYFEDLIQRLRMQFQGAVAEGRKGRLKPEALAHMSDGRVVTGEEALALGLVDEIGDYRDAVDHAARLANLAVPAEVWHPRPARPGLIELLTGPSESTWTGRLLSGAPVGGGWNVFFLW
ncbi:MAG: signal peptide peptidase SppA [Thermoanaerobaculia bacterium]|nr:signal peptide peptidase SppA [Thermoanaerobaculia bacterium]